MDGNNFKTNSNFLLRKCAGGCHGGVDRLTELPDENGVDMITELPDENVVDMMTDENAVDMIIESPDENGLDMISRLSDDIIIFVLSFLSLKEAASTSVLSSRWSNLWKHTPCLNFNTNLITAEPEMQMPWDVDPGMQIPWELRSLDVEKCKYIQMVNSVLRLHKALSLKEFKISLYITESAQSVVTKWFEFLFSRQVERLELDFLCDYDMGKVSLDDLLRDTKVCLPQADVIMFKSLKTLRLRCFKLSGEAIDLFLRNCPVLEQLSIQHTLLTSDVVVCGTTLMLKRLDIYSCSGEISIKVSAPKLTWLRVYTRAQNKLLLEDLPNLIAADFTCTSESLDDAKRFASTVFSFISRWKVLSLTLPYPKVFLANDFPRMRNLKGLVIRYYGELSLSLLPLSTLIWAFPRLREFKLEFTYVARDRTPWMEGLTNVKRPPHRHLKVFKFQGFGVDDTSHYELVTYISNNCVALRKIIISFAFSEKMVGRTDAQLQMAKSAETYREFVIKLLEGKLPRHIELDFDI